MLSFVFRFFAAVLGLAAGASAADLDREMVLAPHAGAAPEDREIVRWQERARGPESRADTFERLGWAYVAKARRTGDAGFYKLAEKTADVAEAAFGPAPEARLLRGHVLHNLHRFAAAETVARGLVAERGAPADFALLSDALIEQGKLAEGIAALQRFAGLKPGAESLSRIAHVRWLKGDLAGAEAALDGALRATHRDDAATRAWLLVRASALALQRGDPAQAGETAERAAALLPAYPPALFALGRARAALGREAEAVAPLREAVALQPLPEYQWWLADVLAANGAADAAAAVAAQLVARGAAEDPRTLALFLATRGDDPARAVRLARAELAQRADVFSHDALAWALFAAGDVAGASAAMAAALAEGTRDARLALHAGEIARAGGDAARAELHFAAARAAAGLLTPSERARLGRPAAAVFSQSREVVTQP